MASFSISNSTQNFTELSTRTLSANEITTETLVVQNMESENVVLNNTVTLTANEDESKYTLTFPTTLPTVSQQIAVDSIAGSNVQLEWATPVNTTIPNLVIVYKGTPIVGSYYNSLYDAMAYINTQSPSATNRYTINIYPGVYTETATVVVPSFVTIFGNFALTTVIKTSGTGHIIQMGNRTDIYFVTIQGPTESGKAGIFLDDVGIGTFVGNCRFVACDYGVIVRPAQNKTCYLYLRSCLFNSNSVNQLLLDSDTNTGTRIQAFSWDSIYYAESSGLLIDTYSELVKVSGANTILREYSGDYERDYDNVIGTGLVVEKGARAVVNGTVFNWLALGATVPSDGDASNLSLNAPEFTDCTENVLISGTLAEGYLFGTTDFSKLTTNISAPWYYANNDRFTITVGGDAEDNFSNLLTAITYVNTLSPSASRRITILLRPGEHHIATTATIPDYVDLQGTSFTSTTLTIDTINTDLIYAGYNSLISNISLYGYGTNSGATNLFTGTGSVAYGVKYRGTSSYTTIGYMEQVVLANHYYMIGIDTPTGTANVIQLSNIRFLGYVNTNTCVKINAQAGSVATAVAINGSRYSPTWVNGTTGQFQYFCKIEGASGIVNTNVFNNINLRSGGTVDGTATGTPLKYGTAFYSNQGDLTLRNSFVKQYNIGIHYPNTSPNPQASLTTSGLIIQVVNTPVSIENTAMTGVLSGTMDRATLSIASPNIAILITDDAGEGTVIGGNLYQAPTSVISVSAPPSNLTPQINQVASIGPLTGGVLTTANDGGWKAYITAGTGYLMTGGTFPDDSLTYIEWDAQNIALTANVKNYIYVDNTGTIQKASSIPNDETAINLGVVMSYTSGQPLYVEQTTSNIRHLPREVNEALVNGLGAIVVSGLIVGNTGVQLTITQGSFYVGATLSSVSEFTAGSAFDGLYTAEGSLEGKYVVNAGLTAVPAVYNNAGTLTAMTGGKFVKHTIYLSGGGSDRKVMMIYGTVQYDDLNSAISGAIASTPSFFTTGVILLAAVIITSPASISQIIDLRPVFVTRTSSIVSTSNHSNLSNLSADDHKQYLLVDGTRAMTGTLQMGANNITLTDGNTVDGVVVHAHASRHLPSGDDPLAIGTPVTIGTTNSQGIAASFALSDHLHSHGAQTDATLHAVATSITNGFMPSTDKAKLDNATSNSTVSTLVMRDASGISNFRGINLNTSAGVTAIALAAPVGTTAYTLTLPSSDGDASQFLQTNGSGTTSWAGAVTSVATGTGLTGGTITSTGTISLANTAVTPASYTLASITVDAQGRLTAASSGSAVTSVATGTGLTGGTITSTGTISLANTAVSAGSYTLSSITVDAQGRLTSASTGNLTGDVTSSGLATTQVIGKVVLKQLSIGQTVSSPVLANITNLSGFSLSASSTYYFRIQVLLTTSGNNDGFLLSTTASGSVASIYYIYTYPTSSTAFTMEDVTSLNGGTFTTTGTTVKRSCTMEGSVTTSGAVTFDIQLRSESGATSATANIGSFAYVQRVS